MKSRTGFGGVITLLVLGMVSGCGSVPEAQVKEAGSTTQAAVAPETGQQIYMAYCASCHGVDGKGGGPAAAALRTAPTDLTMLAAGNNGAYPEQRVYMAARGESSTSAHGSRDMPVWGPAFLAQESPNEGERERRLRDLVDYIRKLQISVQASGEAGTAERIQRSGAEHNSQPTRWSYAKS